MSVLIARGGVKLARPTRGCCSAKMSMSQQVAETTKVDRHFAQVAPAYRALRTTDSRPVRIICDLLGDQALVGVDVGAGTGRYSELLAQLLVPGSCVTGLDLSGEMLGQFASTAAQSLSPVCSTAELLPVRPESLDFVTTFNAIHHFDPTRFVGEVSAALRPGGRLFIYTRTPQQNSLSVFGRLFPGFAERETRLMTEASLCQIIDSESALRLDEVRCIRHARTASPDRLRDQVVGHHYSTFSLYETAELHAALDTFLGRLEGSDIHWSDENVLFVATKQPHPRQRIAQEASARSTPIPRPMQRG